MKILKLILIVILFSLLGALLLHSLNSIDQDIGRHLKSGQIIWETKQIYKTNLFSFTEPNQPFINHHWLSEVVFYLLYIIIGLKGLIVFKAIIILIAFGFIFLSIYKKTGIWPLALSFLIGLPMLIYRSDVRPEIFSYLFLSFFIFAIFRAKYREEYKWLIALPLIQIFWTNMHIYFAIGPGLLLLFAVDLLISKNKNLKKVLLIFFIVTASILVNPNFISGATEPLFILRNYGYSIVENQSIFFLRDYGTQISDINLFEASLLFVAVSFIIAFKFHEKNNLLRKINFELLTMVVFSVMALKMIRNFGLYAFSSIPIAALNLSSIKIRNLKIIAGILLAISVISVFIIFNIQNNNFYAWFSSPKRFGLEIPDGASNAVEFIKQNNIKGPMFNNFDIGSFLIWKMYPEEKVFIDGRPEAYSVDFFEKIYKPMQENSSLWQQYSEQYKINYVIFGYKDMTPWANLFLASISKNPNWPLIYADQTIVIFIKNTPENKGLIGKFGINFKGK